VTQISNEALESRQNLPRFFVEHPAIAWVVGVLVLAWGVLAYVAMPKLKDPVTPARDALVIMEWPGASADQVEQQVTKRLEGVIAQNDMVSAISSASRPGESIINFTLDEYHVKDTAKEFDDVGVKLAQVAGLPDGVGPAQYFNDYGTTTTLMLTVASPPVPDAEIRRRAQEIEPALKAARQGAGQRGSMRRTFAIWWSNSPGIFAGSSCFSRRACYPRLGP
jgi:multidrug efflux pump subunit AcrB